MTLNTWLGIVGLIILTLVVLAFRRIEKNKQRRQLELIRKRLRQRESHYQQADESWEN